MAKRIKRPGEVTCTCDAYDFPHREDGGKCCEETRNPDDGSCYTCGGSGGGDYPMHCTSCGGSGVRREKRSKYREYDDDYYEPVDAYRYRPYW